MKYCKIDCIPSCYHFKFDSGYVFTGHSHETVELNILLSGKMNINIGNMLFCANEGEMFLTPPWVFHDNHLVSDNAEMIVVYLKGEAVRKTVCDSWYARQLDESDRVLVKLLVDSLDAVLDAVYPDVKPKFMKDKSIMLSDNEALPPEFDIMKCLLEVIVSNLISLPCNYKFMDRFSRKHTDICANAVRFMYSHITSKLTLEDIARELRICPAILKATFTDIMGKGVIRYFTEMKIGEASVMLRQGKSIAFVSDYLGFCAPNYFSTVFKRVTGMTPKQAKSLL